MSLTISEKLAKYVIDIQYEQLPEVVVRQAKRCLLDSLGVTFGGYASDSSRIVLDYVRELGGPAECTVIGTQMKLPGVNAILANGAMLRFPRLFGHLLQSRRLCVFDSCLRKYSVGAGLRGTPATQR